MLNSVFYPCRWAHSSFKSRAIINKALILLKTIQTKSRIGWICFISGPDAKMAKFDPAVMFGFPPGTMPPPPGFPMHPMGMGGGMPPPGYGHPGMPPMPPPGNVYGWLRFNNYCTVPDVSPLKWRTNSLVIFLKLEVFLTPARGWIPSRQWCEPGELYMNPSKWRKVLSFATWKKLKNRAFNHDRQLDSIAPEMRSNATTRRSWTRLPVILIGLGLQVYLHRYKVDIFIFLHVAYVNPSV